MNTFQAAHESLIARLEREGKAEEITRLRAERDELAAALLTAADTLRSIAVLPPYRGDDYLGTKVITLALEANKAARAALAKVGNLTGVSNER